MTDKERTADSQPTAPEPAEEQPTGELPVPEVQPETQGQEPVIADLGPDGEGDLSPGDV